MVITEEVLKDVSQTATKMYLMVERFHTDLCNMLIREKQYLLAVPNLLLSQWFTFCKDFPYQMDSEKYEVVARPKIIIEQGFADCKKKSILMGSFLRLNQTPYRFIACSERRDQELHHVFCQGYLNKSWKHLDCTYSNYRMYSLKNPVTFCEVLEP